MFAICDSSTKRLSGRLVSVRLEASRVPSRFLHGNMENPREFRKGPCVRDENQFAPVRRDGRRGCVVAKQRKTVQKRKKGFKTPFRIEPVVTSGSVHLL
jgi:hypothetical protein